ncbi:uncharacterized protein MYCFIDRAFT_198984 [Pseudocercospora fijiensis CIRAD86]|uniref:Uncharacterized protein n=1 Tax=Pseudocercospora fijiensis (strain CIRAD86) TaxID=383855 RepID=M3ANT6_PSEFD|nr:uncharacterized protein MYCFIDRAFT_198984 [Pseudocercospora fijiensis CIRAD86]EME79127.1 hypothetical protein MYCFIDRAFT_198984 [Pseudocercospora fijiensis CIRAD86]
MASPQGAGTHFALPPTPKPASMPSTAGGAAGAIKTDQLMPQNVANQNPVPNEDQPFRFMDLPREMRDNVYVHLKKDSKICRKDAIELFLEAGPRLTLLLVNHQFSKEYLESVVRDAKLVGTDCEDPEADVESIVPFKIDAAQHAEFKLARVATLHSIALCNQTCHQTAVHNKCNAKLELENHVSWISSLTVGLSQLKHIEVVIMVCMADENTLRKDADVESITEEWPVDVRGHSLAAVLQECTPKLQNAATTIKVYCRSMNSREYGEITWAELDVAKAYCTWTSADGWTAGVGKGQGDEKDGETA